MEAIFSMSYMSIKFKFLSMNTELNIRNFISYPSPSRKLPADVQTQTERVNQRGSRWNTQGKANRQEILKGRAQ